MNCMKEEREEEREGEQVCEQQELERRDEAQIQELTASPSSGHTVSQCDSLTSNHHSRAESSGGGVALPLYRPTGDILQYSSTLFTCERETEDFSCGSSDQNSFRCSSVSDREAVHSDLIFCFLVIKVQINRNYQMRSSTFNFHF